MSPLLVLAIAAVAIGLTIRSARRAVGDRHALEAHHRALDTLADMAAHRSPSAPPASLPAGQARPRVAARRPGRGGGRGPGANRRPGDPTVVPPLPAAAASAGTKGPQHRRPRAHRRRPVPGWFVGAVGAAVAIALALALVVAVFAGHHPVNGLAPVAAPRATTPTPSTHPPSTSLPAVLVAGDSQQARFRLGPVGATADLVAVSACWVQIRTGSATGPVVFSGVLRHGDRRPLPVGQAVWVRLGNPPAVSVEVNGTPLPIAAPANQPFNVIIEPAG